jgi:uncharacterized protein YkwD
MTISAAPRWIPRALLSIACGSLLALAFAPAASASRPCPDAYALPGQATKRQLVRSTLCLLNKQRTRRHMRKLRREGRLSHAARGHSADMVHRSYFSHSSPSGVDLVDRVRRAGYLAPARAWFVGENIAWGSGGLSTPKQIVRAWMHSPGHRANILNRSFREIGVGIALGSPRGHHSAAATYTTDFGMRRR